jgi:hypothetical protein
MPWGKPVPSWVSSRLFREQMDPVFGEREPRGQWKGALATGSSSSVCGAQGALCLARLEGLSALTGPGPGPGRGPGRGPDPHAVGCPEIFGAGLVM